MRSSARLAMRTMTLRLPASKRICVGGGVGVLVRTRPLCVRLLSKHER